MFKYEYDKSKFDENSIKLIDKIISSHIDKDVFKLATQLNKNNEPIFNYDQIEQIIQGFKEGLSFEDVKRYAMINNDCSVYDWGQMSAIRQGIKDHLSEDEVKYYSRLNNRGNPVYPDYAMHRIKAGFKERIPLKYIEMYAKIKDGKHAFIMTHTDSICGYVLRHYREGNIDKLNQIKECVDDGLEYYQFVAFMVHNLPANEIRILRSLYKLGANHTDIKNLINRNMSYDELKEIKYFLQCAYATGHTKDVVFYKGAETVQEMRDKLLFFLSSSNATPDNFEKFKELMEKCVEYKMPADQIKYLRNAVSIFSTDTLKKIAVYFINGLTTEEFKKLTYKYETDRSYKVEAMLEDMDDAVRSKFNTDFDLDEPVDFKSQFDDFMIDER